MQDLCRKTLVVLTSGGESALFDKKILGLTSAEWVLKRLAPLFKNAALSRDGEGFDEQECVFVDWDCTLVSSHDLQFGFRCQRLTSASFPLVEKTLQSAIIDDFCAMGVVFHDRQGVVVDATAKIEKGCEIFAPNVIKGNTKIGAGTVIFPYCFLNDAEVGKNCTVKSTFAENCIVGDRCEVGPFAYLRPEAHVGDGCRVGDFVEIKNATLGNNVKCAHLTYVGDAQVGDNTNIGCGTVFANFDGKTKHKTVVGKNCFLGSNVNLIAPVTLGDDVFVAAATTVTHNAPDDCFVIGRCREEIKLKK